MEYAEGLSPRKLYAEPVGGHASLGRALRGLIWLIPMLIVAAILFAAFREYPPVGVGIGVVIAIAWGVIISGIRIAAQWEKGVILRLGKYHRTGGPGIIYVVPFFEYIRFVDLRILALNIPSQKVITKDNVPASIDGVLFFMVSNAENAVLKIQSYQFAIAQYAQASLRDVVGGLSLDELLSERQQIAKQLEGAVEERIKEWGVHVDSIRLLDIEMPEDLKRMMSRQASAEREKRATITKAEGDKIAATNLAAAAEIMRTSPGALQLRTLQTIDGLGPTPSNTVVMFPVELIEMLRAGTSVMLKHAPSAGQPEP